MHTETHAPRFETDPKPIDLPIIEPTRSHYLAALKDLWYAAAAGTVGVAAAVWPMLQAPGVM
ncbi:MAG: hypothetical protein GY700_06550 [Propionibacteriaceae bacterium]|nr:hypothetical protein [Propionibacteriaceae bacterium]